MSDVQPAIELRRSPVQSRPGPPAQRYVTRSGPSPKVRAAILIMVWGADDGIPLKRQDAARAVGIADVTLRNSLANPLTMKFYNEQLDVLRTGERPASVHRIAHLRDKAESERVQLDAAKYLDGGDQRSNGITVNVGVNVQPGYQIGITQEQADSAGKLLKLARSSRNLLTDQANEQSRPIGTDD